MMPTVRIELHCDMLPYIVTVKLLTNAMYAYVIVNLIELACFPCQFFALVNEIDCLCSMAVARFYIRDLFGGSLASGSNLHATVEE